MQFWLFKSEPSKFSIYNMETDKVTSWDGVHNYQAQNYIKIMKLGDLAFFYHTENEKSIVGIVKVQKECYFTNNSKFGLIDVEFSKMLKNSVTLANVRKNVLLKDMRMLKQPRLSISPVLQNEWDEIIRMSGS
ncbi:EVE domain-containing protein [Wolbachia endosymbiont of Pentidionis agamae]|uniref:EVE domain-containing protein n=1 Tax=Wolbachia endosymbiont of Pentidionis agamae TaxID=3110435 RepID=UPI002FD653B8